MTQVPDQLVRLAAQDLHDAQLWIRALQRLTLGAGQSEPDPFVVDLLRRMVEHGKDLKATLPP